MYDFVRQTKRCVDVLEGPLTCGPVLCFVVGFGNNQVLSTANRLALAQANDRRKQDKPRQQTGHLSSPSEKMQPSFGFCPSPSPSLEEVLSKRSRIPPHVVDWTSMVQLTRAAIRAFQHPPAVNL
ncbi:hypothetical protein KEM48_012258 [Puccinia striiformis f. sp. tritici PST-130]|nr:hypothetical protein KEM48_012258 [Puccinia striiformis f. sp. tritici PST-130]